jgi:preprotein translocase subunit SecG
LLITVQLIVPYLLCFVVVMHNPSSAANETSVGIKKFDLGWHVELAINP